MPANNGNVFSSDSWVYIDEPVDEQDGESVPQCFERIASFLEDVIKKHPGETIVICSHAEPLKLMEMYMEGCEYEEKKRHVMFDNYHHEAPVKTDYVFSETAKKLDLHRPYIDEIRITSPDTGKELFRIPEVLDCWFESGSMPYAQMHYPFENKEKMEASFPADYIVEYTGQIRAWFYIMHVLGVILFDKPAYKNVICTGVMQGNDGRKMSKSLGNFPDPK